MDHKSGLFLLSLLDGSVVENHDLPPALLLLPHSGDDVFGLCVWIALQAKLAPNVHHGDPRSEEADLGNVQPDLHLTVLSGDRACALIEEPLVDAGIVLPRLVRQELAVYGDGVVLLGEGGGEVGIRINSTPAVRRDSRLI